MGWLNVYFEHCNIVLQNAGIRELDVGIRVLSVIFFFCKSKIKKILTIFKFYFPSTRFSKQIKPIPEELLIGLVYQRRDMSRFWIKQKIVSTGGHLAQGLPELGCPSLTLPLR